MREPVVDSVDGQSVEDDLVSGLIDDCAGQLEKNNLWDNNAGNSIKHFSDIYNIASQEGDDDDDDSLSFDRLLGHTRLEKSPMESWMAAISSSDVDTTTGINILANASVLRPLIPAAILPASGLLNSAGNNLSQDQTLLPMVRPADRMSMIPVIEQSANKLAFTLARNELPGCHAVNIMTNQSLPVTVSPGQSAVTQTWTSVGNGEGNRTPHPQKAQLKPTRSRANRPKMEMSKPAMNEKESHELERVMDILKRYKQQLAEGDQIGQFLPCKRKRSKPPSQSVDSSSSYSKPSDVEAAEHERAQVFDLTNSKCGDRQTFSLSTSYCESKPQADASALRVSDGIGTSPNNGRVHPSGSLTNSAVFSAILASNDSASSFSPGNSYGATPPVSVLQYSPGAVDQASRCTSVGIDYQMEPPQSVTRHQSSLVAAAAAAGYASNPFGENVPDSTFVNLPANTELEKVCLSSNLCLQTGVPSIPSSAPEHSREETCSVAYSVSREATANSLNVDGEDSAKFTKLTFEQIQQNLPEPIPVCKCLSSNGESSDESKEGPYYTQLGAAESVAKIREIMENRFGITGFALRIEKIVYTGKEGKNPNGCPIAKWIIRRSGEREKVLCLVRKRLGHSCDTAVIVVGIVVWEGIENSQTPNELYDYLTRILSLHGVSTDRRCGSNDQKTCCCQGWDETTGGASFTFGCSWSMFYNGCKFAKSSAPRKFRLKKQQEEEQLEQCLNQLASAITPLYARVAPKSFHNQTQATNANECRLGYTREKPWSGVTAVVDYCTHSHKDINNMHNGCVAVVTLTKHRSPLEIPEDEQLHVLPLYVMDSTDEFGSIDGQHAKVLSGAVECLTQFPSLMRIQQQKPSCHPRRNYRNKSKRHTSPTDKIQKKAAKVVVTNKRIRPPSSRAARLALQKLQTAAEKLLEMEDVRKPGTCGENAEPRGQPGEEASTNDSRTEEAEKQGIMADDIANGVENIAVGTALCNGRSEYVETALQKAYAFPENSNVAQNQQTLESQICESVSDLTPRQIADVMKSLNTLPETSAAELPLSQHVSTDNLEVLWNLENGENARADICNSNQWMKRIEEAADLRNNEISSQDNGVITTAGLSMGFQGIQRSDAVAGGRANACCEEQTINQETPVVDDDAGLPSSSAMLSMPSAYAEKCGGFLQLLNGDDDLGYNEGCLNSSAEFCHPYLHQQELPSEKGDYAKNKPGVESRKETLTKNEHAFKDSNVGGVAIALTHGSVFFEVAKRELHATTAVKNPNRISPTRIALIFYQHKHLNHPDHGNSKQSAKELEQDPVELLVKDSASLDERQSQSVSLGQSNVETVVRSGSSRDDVQSVYGNLSAVGESLWTAPVNNVYTLTTTTMVTKWIQPKLATSGPYQCWG